MLKLEMATQDLLRTESIDLSDYVGRNEEEETKQKDPVSDGITSRRNRAKRKGKIPKKKVVKALNGQWTYLKIGYDSGILKFLRLAKNIHLLLLIWRVLARRKLIAGLQGLSWRR